MTKYAIIGAGPAGMNAIETIRRVDSEGTITLVSDEDPYARMALPYYLADDIPREQLATGSDDYFAKLKVETRFGSRVSSLDTGARSLTFDDGESLAFEKLLIATGSSPARAPIPGVDGANVHTLWTRADADAVLAGAGGDKPSVVLIGAGFIGLIVLNAMYKRGWRLTLIERETRILPRMLDRRGADAAEAWMRDRDIAVHTGCNVTEISGDERKRLALSNGTVIEADQVIVSTGIRPNLEFLDGADIERSADGVLLVDAHCESSVPGIYAAGDVAAGPNVLGGVKATHAIQTTAVDHGRVAGANMAGAEVEYDGSLAMNILDVAGLHMASFGEWSDDSDVTEVWAPARPVYRKLVWRGNRLAGAILIGPIEDTTMLTDVGMVKGLVQAQTDLASWKSYLQEKPWDLRRPYVASGTAAALLKRTVEGRPATPRGYTHEGRQPPNQRSPYHSDLVDTRPEGFENLPRTPTPGIYKS